MRGGRLYGIGPANDHTEGFDMLFATQSPEYRVLSMCIYEVRHP